MATTIGRLSSLQNLCTRLIFVPFEPQEKADIEQNAHCSRGGCGQTDHRQAGIGLDAHNIRHGKTYQQSLHKSLCHDPENLVVAIEVAHHAEQDGSGDGFGCKALEVGVAVGNDSGICRKETGENISSNCAIYALCCLRIFSVSVLA